MAFIIVFFVTALAGATLLAWVIIWSTNRAAHGAITRHFQDSEFILDHGEPPAEWRTLRWGRQASKRDLLTRLDKLLRFYENSAFFDGEEARDELLRQLRDVRDDWRMNLPN